MNKVFLSITALVLLALTVGSLPVHVATEDTTNQPVRKSPEKWSMFDPEERLQIIDRIEKEVGSAVGPIYIALGTADSPYRSTRNETHLFDTYGLMLPRSPLPHVLLSPAESSNKDDLPPPFQYLPLNNVPIGSDVAQLAGSAEPLQVIPANIETENPNRRIPGFMFYNGVPVLELKALCKIPIKMSFVKRMIDLRELDQ